MDLVTASRQHCRYVCLRSFSNEVRSGKIEDASVKAALTRLCSLYALMQVQESGGDWVGHISSKQMTMGRAAVRALRTRGSATPHTFRAAEKTRAPVLERGRFTKKKGRFRTLFTVKPPRPEGWVRRG